MAIFNRSKERWVPTKPLNKTSKNRTVRFERDSTSANSPKSFELNKRLWVWLDALEIDATSVYNLYFLNSDSNDHVVSSFTHQGTDPTIETIRQTRFKNKAIRFFYGSEQGYVSTGSLNLAEMLLASDGSNYLTADSALWISFWFKAPDRYPGEEPTMGHSIGGFVKVLPDNVDTDTVNGVDDPGETKPTIGIYITGDGFVSLRGHTSPANIPIPATIGTDIEFAQVQSARKVLENEWNFISICIPVSQTSNNALSQINFSDVITGSRIWINGIEDKNTASYASSAIMADDADLGLEDSHYLVLGNSNGFWGTKDGLSLPACVGFEGLLGEFTILNHHTDNLDDTARYLYEAYREGVYAVHSGAHSSEPLREIKEQRGVRYYPPRSGGSDQHRMTTSSGSMFQEGALPDTEFDYSASEYFLQSDTVVPHLRVSPNDPILGHWLASDRSIFFEEDLRSPLDDGFTFTSSSIGSEPTPVITEDHLYPRHKQTQTVGPFNDHTRDETNKDFYDAFYIDIPIGGGTNECTLTTDSAAEAPLIGGTAPTTKYELEIGKFSIQYSVSNTVLPFKSFTYSHVSDETYWVPSNMREDAGIIPRAGLFGFEGVVGNNDYPTAGGVPEQISETELLAWLRLIIFLRHFIKATYYNRHEGGLIDWNTPGSERQQFWDNVVYDADQGVIRDAFLENPYLTNTILEILDTPDPYNYGPWNDDLNNALTLPTMITIDDYYGGQGPFSWNRAIWMLKRLGPGDQVQIDWDFDGDPATPVMGLVNFAYGSTIGGDSDLGITSVPNSGGTKNYIKVQIPLLNDRQAYAYSLMINYSTAAKVVEAFEQTQSYWGTSQPFEYTDYNGSFFQKFTILNNDGTVAVQSTGHAMQTMAYHNFSTGNWEPLQSFSFFKESTIDPQGFIQSASIGFSPMSQLIYPYDINYLEEVVDSAGRPTDSFGFPHHAKFKAEDNSTFDLSEYISEPVILKGWELKMDVIPRVGPSQNDWADIGSTGDINPEYDEGSANIANANVVWSGDNASPWMSAADRFNSSTLRQYGTTYPTTATQSSTASNYLMPGQLTKGVTAFLLRQSEYHQEGAFRDTYARNEHLYAVYSNHFQPDATELGSSEIANSISLNWALDAGFYQQDGQRELIGYLQHVYHNDPLFEETTKYRVRDLQDQLLDLEQMSHEYNTAPDVNFGQVFARENNTYVYNLNRNSNDIFDFHVTGSVKLNSKMTDQSVVSPWFSRQLTVTGEDGLFLDLSLSQTNPNKNLATNITIVNSWEGGSGNGELTDGTFRNSVIGEKKGDSWKTPLFNMPISGSTTISSPLEPLSIQQTLDPVVDTDVVLHPNDKLVLGIQDSISTCIGSQLVDSSAGIWKWGRQHLTIPGSQKGAYLRLYLEKQKEEKPVSPKSNQSHGFNEDVNEPLADDDILDSYDVSSYRLLSGSMQDDIIGPSPMTPASAQIRVSFDQFQGDIIDGTPFDRTSYVFPEFEYPQVINLAVNQPTDENGEVIPYNPLDFNWILYNERVYKDRTPNSHVNGTHAAPSCLYKKPNIYELPNGGSGNTNYNDDPFDLQAAVLLAKIWPVTNLESRINFDPNYVGTQTYEKRYGGCTALWELNKDPNRTPPAEAHRKTVQADGTDFSFPATEENPSLAPWRFQSIFPIFQSSSAAISYSWIVLRLSLFAIDKDNKPVAYNPLTASYEEIIPGDIILFDGSVVDTEHGNRPTIVWKHATSEHTGALWSQNTFASEGANFSFLYMAAASGNVGSSVAISDGVMDYASYYNFQSDALTNPTYNPWDTSASVSWDQLMGNIRQVLEVETQEVSGLHYSISTSNSAKDWFQINLIEDNFSISFLESLKSQLNNYLQFSLLGTSGDFNTAGELPDSKVWLYRSGDNPIGGGSRAGFYDVSGNPQQTDYIGDWGLTQFQEEYDNNGVLTVRTIDGSDTTARDMITSGYLLTNTAFNALNSTPNILNRAYSEDSMKIDYSNYPKREGVTLVVTQFENGLKIPGKHNIDRKVTFRTTEANAGPYGSLNRFMKLNSTNLSEYFTDSLTRDTIENFMPNVLLPTLSLSHEMISQWLMIGFQDKARLSFPWIEKITVPGTSDNAGNTILSLPTSEGMPHRRDAILDMTDDSGNTVVFKTVMVDTNSDGLADTTQTDVELKDYIYDTFPELGDVSKTIQDLIGGRGNGPQGRLVLRPSVFEYDQFAGTSGAATHFFMKIDPIRASRYGLMNTRPHTPSAIFSRRAYGQFRDMFEQSIDAPKGFKDAQLSNPIRGAAVIYRAKNPNDPNIEVDLTQNNRRNVDVYQRVSYPFFDPNGMTSDSDGSPNGPTWTIEPIHPESGAPILDGIVGVANSAPDPRLTVNLPGTIATRTVVGPGTLRASLRNNDD